MIWESREWKRGLEQDAERLVQLSRSARTSKTFFEIERIIFLAAYTLRKLAEARKVSDQTRSTKIRATRYLRLEGSRLTHLNWHHIDRHFAMGSGAAEEINALFLCNQLIHSYLFAPVTPGPKQITGFLVASDREKEKNIYSVDIEDFISTMKSFGRDNPTEVRWKVADGKELIEVIA